MKRPDHGKLGLIELSLGRSRTALQEGFDETAMEWLSQVPEDMRPHGLEAEINYQRSKEAASRSEWDVFERLLTTANRNTPTPVYQKRLELARRRKRFEAEKATAGLLVYDLLVYKRRNPILENQLNMGYR